MEHILELHEFFVEGSNTDRSHVLLHITEPSSPEELQKGHFFALAEIIGGTKEQIEHVQLIIDALESGYYETEDTQEKDAFELTVEYVNRRSHHILMQNDAMIICLVGVLRGNELSFAYHGSPQLYLIYSDDTQNGAMNLCDTDSRSREQLFSSITQGTLNAGDYLYAATPHTADYLSIDRIQKIITGRPTRHAAEHVQKILKDLKKDVSFGGLMLHVLKRHEVPRTGSRPKMIAPKEESVIIDIDAQAAKTQHVLSPPLVSGVKQRVQTYKEERKQKESTATKTHHVETNHRMRSAPASSVTNDVLVTIGRAVVGSIIAVISILKRLVIIIGRILVGLILLITNRGGQRETVLSTIRGSIQQKRQWIHDLPLMSKLLFLLTILLAAIFIGSIGIVRLRENREAIAQQYISSVQAIEDKHHAAEASLIYDDRDKALLLLQEAKILLTDLPDNTEERQETKQRLTTTIEQTLLSLRNMQEVVPEVRAPLGEMRETVNTTGLAILDGKIIAYGPNDPHLYILDPVTLQVAMKQFDTSIQLEHDTTPKENDEIVFTTSDNRIAIYSKESEILSVAEITHVNEQAALANIFIYNQRLYAVDVASNQLYRYARTQTGYDKGASWITDETDVSSATSLAIDGDVFVLTSDGRILKFVKGVQEPFSISGLDPLLDTPTTIWTYTDVSHLYVLEPANNRIVVLDKTGKLLTQYVSERFQRISDMVVDENRGVIYILDQNTIYNFPI